MTRVTHMNTKRTCSRGHWSAYATACATLTWMPCPISHPACVTMTCVCVCVCVYVIHANESHVTFTDLCACVCVCVCMYVMHTNESHVAFVRTRSDTLTFRMRHHDPCMCVCVWAYHTQKWVKCHIHTHTEWHPRIPHASPRFALWYVCMYVCMYVCRTKKCLSCHIHRPMCVCVCMYVGDTCEWIVRYVTFTHTHAPSHPACITTVNVRACVFMDVYRT